MTQIKICGITSIQDALQAIEAGADYLGLIFVEQSPRSVEIAQAKLIAQATQHLTSLVGVFQNASVARIQTVLRDVPLNFVQLHGEESVEVCRALPVPVIKMVRVSAESSSVNVQPYFPNDENNIQFLLLEPDGKDRMSVWRQLEPRQLPDLSRCFLAGGLSPENVPELVRCFGPLGVDVASGVERAPGVKDPDKVRAFCNAVKPHPPFNGINLEGLVPPCNL